MNRNPIIARTEIVSLNGEPFFDPRSRLYTHLIAMLAMIGKKAVQSARAFGIGSDRNCISEKEYLEGKN